MGVDEAIQVLYTFLGLGTNPTQKQVQKLCNSYSIKAKNLTLIARVQLRATTVGQQEVAQNLLLAACSLMDHEATFRIVSQAVKQQLLKHHAFQPAMRNLEALAKDKHPQALTLKGQIAMSRGEEAEGLKFLEEATRNTTKITDTGYDVGGPREGWLALGRWKLKREKYTEAKAAFRVAADMDDPVACHYLANLPDTSSEDQHVYLLRAAASGSAQAAHELGLIYLERAKAPSTGKFPTSSKERADWRNTAQEWFNVANFGGHIPSVLELAEMSGEIGLHKVGLELLKTAESFDDVQPYSRLIEEVRHRLSQGSARSQSI
ncbi:MAG: hypothetical protein M1812_001240 [Candelaria pacifica]|nr:MAG: hypothetical protein M1812_001240 [Candelaria pacifica]